MSLAELLVILLVALIAFKPEQLPALAKNIGLGLKKWRSFLRNAQKSIDKHLSPDD